jgi:competence protein ComEC
MTKSKIFFVLSLSFLSGVFAASFFLIEDYFILILVLAGIIVFVVNRKNQKAVVASAAVLFLALGIWRANVSLDAARNNLAVEVLGSVEFVGIVSSDPEITEKNQKMKVESRNLSGGATEYNSEEKNKERKYISKLVYWCKNLFGNDGEKMLITAPIYPEYQYGDELKVSCILQKPENFSENFDYQMYLAKDGIYRVCDKSQITLVAKNRGNKFYSAILAIKNKFEEKLSAIFPEPEGAYFKGLLLGGSKRMPKVLTDTFQRTGTSHTLAVSGYNVTIVAAFLMWLGICLSLWRQQVFSFAVIGIVLFVLMTGAPSSAVRAGIMGTLVIWAMKEGRLANSTNAILFAASAMLLINPLLLRYDAGFQLSFLATIGIVQMSPLLEKFFFRKGRAPKIIQETAILTMSAIIFVLPIILNSFEKLPLVSPVANLLILPAIPAIMGLGFAAGIAGFVFLPLGKLVGFLPYLMLKIELVVIQWLANLPWASVEVKNFGWKYILTYYLVLFPSLYFYKRKIKKLDLIASEE